MPPSLVPTPRPRPRRRRNRRRRKEASSTFPSSTRVHVTPRRSIRDGGCALALSTGIPPHIAPKKTCDGRSRRPRIPGSRRYARLSHHQLETPWSYVAHLCSSQAKKKSAPKRKPPRHGARIKNRESPPRPLRLTFIHRRRRRSPPLKSQPAKRRRRKPAAAARDSEEPKTKPPPPRRRRLRPRRWRLVTTQRSR